MISVQSSGACPQKNPIPCPRAEFLCIGNAIVDVFADVDSAFMNRMGICETVQHITRGHAGKILAELGVRTLRTGGGAANAAKIASGLGGSAAFLKEWLAGKSIGECLRQGNKIAGESLQQN